MEQASRMGQAGDDNMSKLMGALIAELASQVAVDSRLEIVRSDLMAASKAASNLNESGKRDELTLRFYLVITFLLRELNQMSARHLAEHTSAEQTWAEHNSGPSPEAETPTP